MSAVSKLRPIPSLSESLLPSQCVLSAFAHNINYDTNCSDRVGMNSSIMSVSCVLLCNVLCDSVVCMQCLFAESPLLQSSRQSIV